MFVLIFEMSIFYAPYMYVYIIYIYTYLYLSLYTYDTDLWFMPCCCPYTFVAKQCLSGWNHTVPPGPRVGRSVIRSRWFHFMDSTFWKFTSSIYVWLQISYIYTLYILVSDIYIYIRYIHMLNHSELPFLQGWLGNSHGKSVLHRWEIIELSRHASLRRASWKWWRPQRLQPFQA